MASEKAHVQLCVIICTMRTQNVNSLKEEVVVPGLTQVSAAYVRLRFPGTEVLRPTTERTFLRPPVRCVVEAGLGLATGHE